MRALPGWGAAASPCNAPSRITRVRSKGTARSGISRKQEGDTQIRPNRVGRAKTLKQVEEEYIRLILDETGGNHSQAARMLGIDRRTLYRRLSEMENEGVSE